MSNIAKYESDRVITRNRIWDGMYDFSDVAFFATAVLGLGGVLTAALAFFVSLWFILLAIIPVSIATMMFIESLTESLNEESCYFDGFTNRSATFNKRETVKVMLRIPFNKSLTCGSDKILNKDLDTITYGMHQANHTFHIENMNGQIHMVKRYQEIPDYTWEKTFSNATKGIDLSSPPQSLPHPKKSRLWKKLR